MRDVYILYNQAKQLGFFCRWEEHTFIIIIILLNIYSVLGKVFLHTSLHLMFKTLPYGYFSPRTHKKTDSREVK